MSPDAVERLETRRLLSEALPKIGHVLGFLAGDFAARPEAAMSRAVIRNKPYALAAAQPNARLIRTDGDTVFIDAYANDKGPKTLTAQLETLGATITSAYGYALTAAVPVRALAAVNNLSGLQFADASYAAVTRAGLVDDYTVQAMNADRGQKQFAVDGTGVRVGVMSNSYNALGGAAADVASGDLPANVTVVDEGGSGQSDEGRAMAQIIHDVAPGAAISFATAGEGISDFASNILLLAKPTASGGQNAKVIVDDEYYLQDPFFQDGIIGQAINTAYNSYNTSYFSSAGNDSNHSYEAVFNGQAASVAATTTLAGTTAIGSGTFEDFDPSAAGTNIYQAITLAAGEQFQISYQWDSPFYSASRNAGGTAGSANSVSLYLLDSDKAHAVLSATSNRVGGDAYQILDYTNTTSATVTYYFVAKVTAGAAPGFAKYVDYAGEATIQYATNSGTSTGHSNASGAMGVGAAYFKDTPAFNTTPPVKESFSAVGGVGILFDANGTRKAAAEVRQQPDIVAPDGDATTFFGSVSTTDGQHHFYGTSAAAPNAAGVAALLLQAKPTLTNAQIYSTLQTTAIDMSTAGVDINTGYGLIQADAALASVAASSISGTIYRDLNADGVKDAADTAVGGKTVFLDSNNNGLLDTGTTTLSNTTAVAIPDSTAASGAPSRGTSSITSAVTGRVTRITTTVNASHANFSETGFTLVTPSGVRIPLLTTLYGYASGTGTGINVTFSDTATNYIQGFYSTAVLGGTAGATYKPQTPLAAAAGESAAGTWQLEARDYKSGTTGTINSWSLAITYADPSTATDTSGNYAFNALTPSAFYGTYRVRTGALSGLTLATPASPYDLTLARSQTLVNQNFGFVAPQPATVASIVLDDGTAQRSSVRSLTVTFNGSIPAANFAADAFMLTRTSGPSIGTYAVTVGAVTTPAAGQTAVRLTFAGSAVTNGSVADGRYTLTIDGSRITDASGTKADAAGTGAAGSIRTYNFYRLLADIDGSAAVDFNDFLALQTAFGSTAGTPAYNAGADIDLNGVVDFNDFLSLQTQFGASV